MPNQEVKISDGEIMMIDAKGTVIREQFTPPVSSYGFFLLKLLEPIGTKPTGYRKYMMDYTVIMGIPKKELDRLHHTGYHPL